MAGKVGGVAAVEAGADGGVALLAAVAACFGQGKGRAAHAGLQAGDDGLGCIVWSGDAVRVERGADFVFEQGKGVFGLGGHGAFMMG